MEATLENQPSVTVIGGGLAGCEAAWQAARRGVKVHLLEMRPLVMTPVHRTPHLAELVCSNSLGSMSQGSAPGLLKEELRLLDSLVMEAADHSRVPAGQALAVDRDVFSSSVEKALLSRPEVTLTRKEECLIPAGSITVLATGPMTSEAMVQSLQAVTGSDYLYFYDAVSPVVSLESLDSTRMFRASRYGKGEGEYLNCPLSEEEYGAFHRELTGAGEVEAHQHEQKFFEGCLPVEEIAKRGRDTLRFGPMKPVGLNDPATGQTPYAVVQLRQENREGTLYNLVGFQTRLTWSEQRRVFRMIPALREAEFVRLGVMHRNIFINAPRHLEPYGSMRGSEGLFIAGQLSGVEGYMESTASGLLCGINAALKARGEPMVRLPATTALGALMEHITTARPEDFQPMGINFGLITALEKRIKKKAERNKVIRERALRDLGEFIEKEGLLRRRE
ncbi:MAG: methylenetetrahydrofolate--tRNA-(uracil(54)-C(5))-methyltransferase (FADH(2)-oxidizing) TrmFO [Candidatus Eremiobacteraeota bacterium]|nr:methylenetetrahydrofolate--tRNA-(uracil(54)-C(5))-methyltransferase (FADH(2)-oxidizing) TrmFO [Candidatus Eremiobacteraeota bacterium]